MYGFIRIMLLDIGNGRQLKAQKHPMKYGKKNIAATM
jgi:hypothetical protein